jgi:hypothetical protein
MTTCFARSAAQATNTADWKPMHPMRTPRVSLIAEGPPQCFLNSTQIAIWNR